MAKHNTHRSAGRAQSPAAARMAYKGLGGAAMLGTVVVGSAFASTSAHAAPTAPSAPAEIGSVAPATPVAASADLSSGSTLHKGTSGERVETLQSLLNDEGADLEVDGKFGPRTHDAVIEFQSDKGLEVDGRVGPETRGALNGGSSDSDSSESSSSSSSNGQAILDAARSQVGSDYVFAGSSPGGFDCSGLTSYAYAQAGIDLPHSSGAQADGGNRISQSEAQVGDLVVWPGHVGIYAGDGKVVDAGSSKGSVSERSIWGSPSFVSYR